MEREWTGRGDNNTHSASSGGLLIARNTQFVKIVSRIISSKYVRYGQGIKRITVEQQIAHKNIQNQSKV